jgi:hypothetical protein
MRSSLKNDLCVLPDNDGNMIAATFFASRDMFIGESGKELHLVNASAGCKAEASVQR